MFVIVTTHTDYSAAVSQRQGPGHLRVQQVTPAEARAAVQAVIHRAGIILDIGGAFDAVGRAVRDQCLDVVAADLGVVPPPDLVPWSPHHGEAGVYLPRIYDAAHEGWPRTVTDGDILIQYKNGKYVILTVWHFAIAEAAAPPVDSQPADS